jgi:hypothetical protein
MPPRRVLPRHPADERLDRRPGGGSSWPAPVGVGPLTGNQVTVPAQNRRRSNRKHLRPAAPVDQPRQRRQPKPVGLVPPRPATKLAAQHLVLMATPTTRHPWTDQTGPAPSVNRTGISSSGRPATTTPRDGPSHGTDLAAKPQLTTRNRAVERDRSVVGGSCAFKQCRATGSSGRQGMNNEGRSERDIVAWRDDPTRVRSIALRAQLSTVFAGFGNAQESSTRINRLL